MKNDLIPSIGFISLKNRNCWLKGEEKNVSDIFINVYCCFHRRVVCKMRGCRLLYQTSVHPVTWLSDQNHWNHAAPATTLHPRPTPTPVMLHWLKASPKMSLPTRIKPVLDQPLYLSSRHPKWPDILSHSAGLIKSTWPWHTHGVQSSWNGSTKPCKLLPAWYEAGVGRITQIIATVVIKAPEFIAGNTLLVGTIGGLLTI